MPDPRDWQGNILDRCARVLLPIAGGALFLTVLGTGWFIQPDRFAHGFAPEQPLPYSHKLHAGTLSIPCLYCHTGATKSRHAGIPAVETCMNCHRVTKTDSPAIRKLTELYENDRPLEWRRVHDMPDHVYFDHRPHVNGGIACQTCHGEIQEMEVVAQRMSMRMSNCLGCHRDPRRALPADSEIRRGPEYCNTCHR